MRTRDGRPVEPRDEAPAAIKSKIAEYPADCYSAEVEDGVLTIFAISPATQLPNIISAAEVRDRRKTADAGRNLISQINKRNKRFWNPRGGGDAA